MQLADIASGEVIIILLVVVLLVFGSSKLPKIARGLGTAKTEFEKGLKEGHSASSTDDPSTTDKPAS